MIISLYVNVILKNYSGLLRFFAEGRLLTVKDSVPCMCSVIDPENLSNSASNLVTGVFSIVSGRRVGHLQRAAKCLSTGSCVKCPVNASRPSQGEPGTLT